MTATQNLVQHVQIKVQARGALDGPQTYVSAPWRAHSTPEPDDLPPPEPDHTPEDEPEPDAPPVQEPGRPHAPMSMLQDQFDRFLAPSCSAAAPLRHCATAPRHHGTTAPLHHESLHQARD